MVDILDEILNDDKDARRFKIFRKILPVVIVITIIIALGIAGYSWFSAVKTRHNQEVGDLFVNLVSGDEYNDEKLIMNSLEEIKTNGKNKLSELAALKLVNNQMQIKNITEAIKQLEVIINNKEYSEITTSYAKILYISLILDITNLNGAQENKSREYLQYFNKEYQVFYTTATLLKSLFYLKNDQLDLAKKYAFEVLKLPRASGVIKEQAKAIIANIAIRAQK